MTEPVVRALLTADRIIKEDNGKHSLIGIFDRFGVASFPATLPPWGVYASIANLSNGKHKFAINLVHDQTSGAVLGMGGDIDVKESGSSIEVSLPVQGATFPEPGTYTMSLHIDGEHVATRIITVQQAKAGG